MEDVEIGWVLDQRVNGNGFSQRSQIAHVRVLLGARVNGGEPTYLLSLCGLHAPVPRVTWWVGSLSAAAMNVEFLSVEACGQVFWPIHAL
jgi:hypothetical protein